MEKDVFPSLLLVHLTQEHLLHVQHSGDHQELKLALALVKLKVLALKNNVSITPLLKLTLNVKPLCLKH